MMTAQKIVEFQNGRRLIILSMMSFPGGVALDEEFAVLLTGANSAQREVGERVVKRLLGLRCLEFCCVGSQAEMLHDAIDGIVENRGVLDVVTTWFEDCAEGCDYFVHAAGGGARLLLAYVDEDSEQVTAALERATAG